MGARLRTVGALVALVAVVGGCSEERPASTAPPPSGSVWVADEGRDSLTVIDAASGDVAMTLTGITAPHNVQVGRDGSAVYAVSSAGVVVAIDAATYAVIAVAPTGPQPAHVIEAPNGKVYVTNSGDGTVSVYQAPDLSPLGRIAVNGMPHGLRPAAGGSMIVVANTSAGALDLIDPATDRYIGTVPVGTGPAQVAVSADGTYAYTGISEPPSIVKVDLSQRRVVDSAPVPLSPVQVYLTPDEKTVLSADQGSRAMPGDTVSVIDTAEMTSRATVTTGAGPHGVVIDAAGTWAWVTNSYADTVTPIDLSSMAASTPIPVGTGPNGISYSARAPAAAPAAVIALQIPVPAARGPQPADSGAHSGHGH
ncbi:hypothetical protein [Mycolicibacterium sp.]|uniref:hypothetical protein n=1 Tax=Mycolicibacterium sp. TaxID=2320850 RepID=UPI0037C75ADA